MHYYSFTTLIKMLSFIIALMILICQFFTFSILFIFFHKSRADISRFGLLQNKNVESWGGLEDSLKG